MQDAAVTSWHIAVRQQAAIKKYFFPGLLRTCLLLASGFLRCFLNETSKKHRRGIEETSKKARSKHEENPKLARKFITSW
jgi:hypothetical protein